MRHRSGAIRLLGLVLVMFVLTGVGPARSVAEGPTLTLADDFQSGPGSVWRLQRVRADALKSVVDKHGVNLMATICASDKATLSSLVDYWVPGTEIGTPKECAFIPRTMPSVG